MRSSILLATLLATLPSGLLAREERDAESSAHEKSGRREEFRFSGRLDLVERVPDSGAWQTGYELRLGAKSPRKAGLRATLEIKAEEGSRDVALNEGFLDFRRKGSASRWRVGRGKKVVGWEYELPTDARLTAERSSAYEFLASRSTVGRDFFVSFERRLGESEEGEGGAPSDTTPVSLENLVEESVLRLALHSDESSNAALIASLVGPLGSGWSAGTWLLAQRNSTPTVPIGSWAAAGGILWISGSETALAHRAAFEAFLGTDPQRLLFERQFGSGRAAQFLAFKTEYALYLSDWSPYAQVTGLFREVGNPRDRELQSVFGLRYRLMAKFSVAGETELRSNVSISDPLSTSFDRRIIRLYLRAYF